MPRTIPLTLIVAATTKLGIGQGGKLPWPSLQTEMGYFRRVTTRVPAPTAAADSSSSSSTTTSSSNSKAQNAVIMGRKTWDSIPPKFRPLKGRLNVVITRSGTVAGLEAAQAKGDTVLVANSLEQALEALNKQDEASSESPQLGEAFIIGGSTLYTAALALPQAKRVLLTKIYREYECDTFLPFDLDGEKARGEGWVRKGWDQLERYVGSDVVEGVASTTKGTYHGDGKVTEGDVEFEFCLYERD